MHDIPSPIVCVAAAVEEELSRVAWLSTVQGKGRVSKLSALSNRAAFPSEFRQHNVAVVRVHSRRQIKNPCRHGKKVPRSDSRLFLSHQKYSTRRKGE